MTQTGEGKRYRIRADSFRHCLTCRWAEKFVVEADRSDELEDMCVECRFFPLGDKLVSIGTDCPHYASIRRPL